MRNPYQKKISKLIKELTTMSCMVPEFENKIRELHILEWKEAHYLGEVNRRYETKQVDMDAGDYKIIKTLNYDI